MREGIDRDGGIGKIKCPQPLENLIIPERACGQKIQ